jgi:hypothetical protein
VVLPLLHVPPSGFHRIRHYGLFANGGRAENIARARQLLDMPTAKNDAADVVSADDTETQALSQLARACGGRMIIIETFERGDAPRYRPAASVGIDTPQYPRYLGRVKRASG